MPVWGTIFRGLDPDDQMTQIRIQNIVEYSGITAGDERSPPGSAIAPRLLEIESGRSAALPV